VDTHLAVVSVQADQPSNNPAQPQQQQIVNAPSMMYQPAPMRFFSPDYVASRKQTSFCIHTVVSMNQFESHLISTEGGLTPMHGQQMQFYYSISNPSIIQAAGVGSPQNIMVQPGNSSATPLPMNSPSMFYSGGYPGNCDPSITCYQC
jgi:hypothetical protein